MNPLSHLYIETKVRTKYSKIKLFPLPLACPIGEPFGQEPFGSRLARSVQGPSAMLSTVL